METVLQTYGLTKQYGSFTALSNLDLALERGKIIGLLGPAGDKPCGKVQDNVKGYKRKGAALSCYEP